MYFFQNYSPFNIVIIILNQKVKSVMYMKRGKMSEEETNSRPKKTTGAIGEIFVGGVGCLNSGKHR